MIWRDHLNVGVKLVDPSLPTLLPAPAGEVQCDLRPPPFAEFLHLRPEQPTTKSQRKLTKLEPMKDKEKGLQLGLDFVHTFELCEPLAAGSGTRWHPSRRCDCRRGVAAPVAGEAGGIHLPDATRTS